MIGRIIKNRYKIVSQLGNGSFGIVYLAEDIDRPGNPQCIVKQLKPIANDPFILQVAERLFNEEARVLEKLGKHDQIPTLLAHFKEHNEFYLVQEFIEGKTLRQEIIERKKQGQVWTENEVIEILKSILEPLNSVHQINVIHRDLKPDNLIVREHDKKIVIIDFGAVKQRLLPQFSNTDIYHAPTVNATVIIGTKGYMPTEQLRGFPTISSDIYAVGMIIIEMLTGLFPESLNFDQNGEVIWQSAVQVKISQKSINLLKKMIKCNVHKRYQNVQEILQKIKRKTTINFKYLLASLLSIFITIASSIYVILMQKQPIHLISYQEQKHNLMIDYPEKWLIQNNPNVFNQDFVKFIAPLENQKDSFQENVTLTIENLQNNPLSLEEYTNEVYTEIKNNLDPTVATPINITFANKQGKKIIFETQENQIKIKRMQVWTIENYQVYILTFSATSEQFPQMSFTFEEIIQSFQVNLN